MIAFLCAYNYENHVAELSTICWKYKVYKVYKEYKQLKTLSILDILLNI